MTDIAQLDLGPFVFLYYLIPRPRVSKGLSSPWFHSYSHPAGGFRNRVARRAQPKQVIILWVRTCVHKGTAPSDAREPL